MRNEGCPPKELMDELLEYWEDVQRRRVDNAYEYKVPEWVMERAVRAHEQWRGWRFKDYWWLMDEGGEGLFSLNSERTRSNKAIGCY